MGVYAMVRIFGVVDISRLYRIKPIYVLINILIFKLALSAQRLIFIVVWRNFSSPEYEHSVLPTFYQLLLGHIL